jgi:large subunit ribosomal protein L32
MAHPKHRISKQRRDKRRTHYKAVMPTLAKCSNPSCGATVIYHRVCPECGYYRGRLVIDKQVSA